jgi:hypothetical protein
MLTVRLGHVPKALVRFSSLVILCHVRTGGLFLRVPLGQLLLGISEKNVAGAQRHMITGEL